jgi:hypothetical protein
MSWLRALELGLNVTTTWQLLSANEKLEVLRAQGAAEEARQQYVRAMKQQLFECREAVEAALSSEADAPLKTAGALQMIRARVEDFEITTACFDAFDDKEYARTVLQAIQHNATRLWHDRTPEEQQQINGLVDAMRVIPAAEMYLRSAHQFEALRQKRQKIEDGQEQLQSDRRTALLLAIPMIIMVVLGAVTQSLTLSWLGLLSAIPSVYIVTRSSFRQVGTGITKISAKFLDFELDDPELRRLHDLYGTAEQAMVARDTALEKIRTFFGNSAPLRLT